MSIVFAGALAGSSATASTPQACTVEFPAQEPAQSGGVFEVSEPAHLSWILEEGLDGKFTVYPHLAIDYEQTANIDLEGCVWTPLDGMVSAAVPANKETGTPKVDAVYGFTGSYDGGGFTLSGLHIPIDELPINELSNTVENDDSGDAYNQFRQIGFIGDLNGGSLQNLTLADPEMTFVLGSVDSGRATINNLGFAVGRADGATISDITVTNGTVSINCSAPNPTLAQCDASNLGGAIGSLEENPSDIDAVTTSVSFSALASDAPEPEDTGLGLIVSLQPNGFSLSAVGGVLGGDSAGSELSTLQASGSFGFDFPSANELGGIAGRLEASELTKSRSTLEMNLTNPLLLPGDSRTGGFLRVGGLVGLLDLDSTVALSEATGSIDIDIDAIHLSDDPEGERAGGCMIAAEGGGSYIGNGSPEWQNSDNTTPDCKPLQAVAEVGGLLGVILDPSTAGPSATSSRTTSTITIDVLNIENNNPTNPELAIGAIGSAVGSVFQDQNTNNHEVLATTYAAGSVSIVVAESLTLGGPTDPLGVYLSEGQTASALPGSLVGFWTEEDHSVALDTLWDQNTYPSASARGGVARSTEAMTSASTYQTANWPLVNGWATFSAGETEWGLCDGVDQGYPFLLWPQSSDPCPPPSKSSGPNNSQDDDTVVTADAPSTTSAPSPVSPVTPPGTDPADDANLENAPENEGPSADTESLPLEDGATSNPPSTRTQDSSQSEPTMWPLVIAALGGIGVLAGAATLWALSGSSAGSSTSARWKLRR